MLPATVETLSLASDALYAMRSENRLPSSCIWELINGNVTRAVTEGQKRTKKKRPDGDGCVYFDAKAKLWRAELMVGYRTDGKEDIRKVSSRHQAACMDKLNKLKEQRDRGELGDPSARSDTLAAFLRRWLDAIAGTVRPSTLYRYRMLVNTHLIPAVRDHE